MKIAVRTYLSAVKLLWRSGLLIFIPVFNAFLVVFVQWTNRNYSIALSIPASLFALAVEIVIELLVIIMVLKDKNMIMSDKSSMNVAIKYFWKVVGIKVGSIFALLLVISPLCFFLFLLALADLNYIFSVLLVFTVFIYMIFYFGANLLGIRILVSQDKRIGESMWAGYLELRTNRSYYFGFMAISFFLFFLPSIVSNVISLVQSGLSMFSAPLVPYNVFYGNYLQVIKSASSKNVITWLIVFFRYFMSPVNIAAITFAYTSSPSLHSSIVIPQSEIRN